MRFQSFFMLMTVQPFFFASAIRVSGNVPTLNFGPYHPAIKLSNDFLMVLIR
jgi:hypothetical protein